MKEPIKTKTRMYELLSAGALGNTISVYFSLGAWRDSPDWAKYHRWGIRNGSKGGDPRMRLNVPTLEVADLYNDWYPDGGGNISPMIDQWAVVRGEVWESDYGHPFGLNLFYVPAESKIDPADPWRGSFKKYGTRAHGVKALTILREYLWPGDWEDIRVLLDHYPGHVVEFSACDRPVGVIPGRNTVVWEVRLF